MEERIYNVPKFRSVRKALEGREFASDIHSIGLVSAWMGKLAH